jgi:hypothetical protein
VLPNDPCVLERMGHDNVCITVVRSTCSASPSDGADNGDYSLEGQQCSTYMESTHPQQRKPLKILHTILHTCEGHCPQFCSFAETILYAVCVMRGCVCNFVFKTFLESSEVDSIFVRVGTARVVDRHHGRGHI